MKRDNFVIYLVTLKSNEREGCEAFNYQLRKQIISERTKFKLNLDIVFLTLMTKDNQSTFTDLISKFNPRFI
jgi:hypothetical protein